MKTGTSSRHITYLKQSFLETFDMYGLNNALTMFQNNQHSNINPGLVLKQESQVATAQQNELVQALRPHRAASGKQVQYYKTFFLLHFVSGKIS
jgi:hypothetical protein